MRIVADEKIPFLKGVLEPFAQVSYLPGDQISKGNLTRADALLVRTRTFCNELLLSGTAVSFVGSATIGTDHIDTQWLNLQSIRWVNAPGCNADSVEQYVSAALLYWLHQHQAEPNEVTIGIVGVGNVGSRVANSCKRLGMNVLLNDPPRARQEGSAGFCSLDELIRESDIITFHVPLTRTGQDKTYHLVNDHFISKIQAEALLINTCRGEVFDTQAVIEGINAGTLFPPIIDCWENEPRLSIRFLDRAYLATPHIAGYAQEGKSNGTKQVIRALAEHFGLPLTDWEPTDLPAPDEELIHLSGRGKSVSDVLREAILHTYPIWEDDELLRAQPLLFEDLRGNYRIRRQYEAFTVQGNDLSSDQKKVLQDFRFNIIG